MLKKWETPQGKSGSVIAWDITSYYGYLPATFIHNDLSLKFLEEDPQYYHNSMRFWPKHAPNGGYVFKMTMGLSIMYSPFFLMAHGYAHLFGYETDGFSPPYHMFLAFAGLFYCFLGLFYLRKILRMSFNEWVTVATILSLVLGTNLFFYTTAEGAMSHVFNFALITAFIYHSIKWHENQQWKISIYLGLLGGLIVLIRPVNLAILIIPFLMGVLEVGFIQKMRLFGNQWKKIAVMLTGGLLVLLPQILYWKFVTGDFIFYSYDDEGFFFSDPKIWDGLFSYRKGWFVYTPIMLLAVIGIFFLKKIAQKQFILSLLFFLPIFWYISFSWWCWWYGGSFGMRPMVDIYGLMAIPLAALFHFLCQKKYLGIFSVVAISGFFIFLNQLQNKQYRICHIHWDSMSKELFWGTFLHEIKTKKEIDVLNQFLDVPDYEAAKKGDR